MTKILLVEDDKSLREIYGVRLIAEGYEIVSAGDGEQALAMAVKEKPDLIISDVMMPKISGFDMLDILRATPDTKQLKVIMMTALSSEDQRTRGESLGADRYLVKSQVGIEDVVRTVHDVLSDSPISQSNLQKSNTNPVTANPQPSQKDLNPINQTTAVNINPQPVSPQTTQNIMSTQIEPQAQPIQPTVQPAQPVQSIPPIQPTPSMQPTTQPMQPIMEPSINQINQPNIYPTNTGLNENNISAQPTINQFQPIPQPISNQDINEMLRQEINSSNQPPKDITSPQL